MKLIQKTILSSLCLFCTCAFLRAVEISDFSKMKTLEITDANAEIGGFAPDAEIYAVANNLRSDIRLVGADGLEIPFTVTTLKENKMSTAQTSVTAKISKFSNEDNGAVRIRCSIEDPKNLDASRLEIVTNARNFDKYVKIYAVEDLSQPVAEGAFFDYSNRIDFRNKTFDFPKKSPSGVYEIVIDKYTEIKESPISKLVSGDTNLKEFTFISEEPKIDGIRFFVERRETALADVMQTVECKITSNEEKKGDTIITFTTEGFPLSSLSVECSEPLYSRSYSLSQSYDNDFTVVKSGKITFSNLSSLKIDKESTITFTPVVAKNWKLTIHNGDLAPLHNLTLHGSAPAECVTFLQKDVALPITCYYAAEIPQPLPKYELSHFLTSGKNGPRITASLLPENVNPAFTSSILSLRPIRKVGMMAFYVFMGLAILAAFVFIFKNIGKIEKMED